MVGQLRERLEMRLHALDEWGAVHLVLGHEFGKGELHFVIAHQPAAQLRLRGMTTGAQGVQQRVATQSTLAQGVGERGVTAAPRTQ